MKELLELFVSETRELLETIGKGLLALEKDPADAERLNEVFRATHTLKSSGAMFDYHAMTALMHACEDMLDALRQGELELTSARVDQLLDSFDRVGQWVDHVEAHECLPEDARAVTESLLTELRALMPAARVAADSPAEGKSTGHHLTNIETWLHPLDENQKAILESASRENPLILVRYTPDPRCFFTGDDPFALMCRLPGLLLLHMEPVEPWPALDEMDPYNCQLRFIAAGNASRTAVTEHLHPVRNQVELADYPLVAPTQPTDSAAPDGRAQAVSDEERQAFDHVVREQVKLLGLPSAPELWQGIVNSVAGSVCNGLKCLGRHAEIRHIETALQQTLQQHNHQPLLEALQAASRPAEEPSTAQVEIDERADSGKVMLSKTLKVDQARIDKLMDLVGELMVAKNSLPYLAQRAEQGVGGRELAREIKEQHRAIDHLAEALQYALMQVRMLPMSRVLQPLPRLVRDLARELDKRVDLVLEGQETEADKNVIEMLSEPLLHLVRNSVGHGIEQPEIRRAQSKPETGRLHIRAWQESEQICLEVQDDGRGIDPHTIRERIRAMKLLETDKLAAMNDNEVIQYVFAAGLSTAGQISGLAGRGVGMDVVHSSVEQLGGTVTLHSEVGEGTRITLALPLSAAVSRVMIFNVCGQKFGLPISTVVETLRLPLARVQQIKHRTTFLWRNRTIPLVSLRNVLQLETCAESRADEVAVLVIKHYGEYLGLMVSDFHEGMNLILKPLEGVLADVPGYVGTALLGDGSVLLVLNLRELL